MTRHPFEFEITMRFMNRYIKPGDKVLDLGGGPGRYSFYLSEMGCDVTLLDLSEGNVAFAAEKAAEGRLKIKTVCGDAREADKLVGGEFDVILLMGPMYHLLDEDDRVRAMDAAVSLLRPGGVIFVSFIALYAGIAYYLNLSPGAVLDDRENEYLECCFDGRTYCGDAFTRACFINPGDVLPFMKKFPLEKLHLFGQEGVTSPGEKSILECPREVIEKWIDIAYSLCEREELLSYSAHLMYVGRKI
jgi:SAM-dependent methyltransferase